MRTSLLVAVILALSPAVGFQLMPVSSARSAAPAGYIGFDRNDYPGDLNLKRLRRTFSFTGYWLNNPPGAKTNSWTGNRKPLQDAAVGCLVLFNGRMYAEIRAAGETAKVGSSAAAAAIRAAR